MSSPTGKAASALVMACPTLWQGVATGPHVALSAPLGSTWKSTALASSGHAMREQSAVRPLSRRMDFLEWRVSSVDIEVLPFSVPSESTGPCGAVGRRVLSGGSMTDARIRAAGSPRGARESERAFDGHLRAAHVEA